MDGVDEAEVVVGQEKAVGTGAQKTAGASVDDWFAVVEGEKPSEEVARCAVCVREAHEAVAGADARVTCTVQGDEKAVAECLAIRAEVCKSERRAVRGEGGVGGGNVAAAGERRRLRVMDFPGA